mgnify:CR=1 FL=1
MNLENAAGIGKLLLCLVVGLPWAMGIILFIATWFGDGLSTGKQTKIISKYEKLIEDCENDLPRNEHCKLVAQSAPIIKVD